jgi:archaellum component FlaG (FlaF/FlaG flagellin family)
MKRLLLTGALLLAVPALFTTGAWGETKKANPADYTVKVHVSAAQYVATDGLFEILTVVIDGKHYQLQGATSSSKAFMHGNGLLNPGDYSAKLTVDTHKTAYESIQMYELLMPDGTTRPFSVIFQGE